MRGVAVAVVVVAALTAGGASAQPAAAPPATPPTPAAPTPAAGPRTFVIDAKQSVLAVQVFKDGAAAALAHNHVVSATTISGRIVVDPANSASARIDVSLPTAGLVNDDPKLRKRFGVTGDVPEGDRKMILEHMQDEGQLDIAHFPTMQFSSTSTTGTGSKLVLNGKLTMHGVTRDISVPVDVTFTDTGVRGTGSVKLKTSDFGIEPYSAFLGAVKNKDGIVLHIDLVATAG
jgi:polyisoprenoid-binding protein YceI